MGLEAFGKSKQNVVALAGDSSNINRSLSTKIEISVSGCASLLIQGIAKDLIGEEEVIIAYVKQPMTKLRMSLTTVKIQRITVLRQRLHESTR